MKTKAEFSGGRRTTSNTLRVAPRGIGIRTALAAALVAGMSLAAFAQDFQNLDFELASGLPAPPSFPASAAIGNALPGWTGYCGPNQQTTVLYEAEWLDTAGISILDYDSSFDPAAWAVTHGLYCVALYSGFQWTGGYRFDAETWIAQTGRIPATASNLLFNYSTSSSSSAWGDGRVNVSFNGFALPVAIVSGGAYGFSVRGVDVRPFAGQVGELRFTAPTGLQPGHWRNMFLLDDIRFTPNTPPQDQFNCTTNNGAITITGYAGPGGAVTIPGTINGLPVTRIGYYAFMECRSLTSVTIPNSVTSIGERSFYGCTNLKGVYFRGNAPSLGGSAVFYGDNDATVYYLPGTTGWGSTFGGRPTVIGSLADIVTQPTSQTAEAGSMVRFQVVASGYPPPVYQWCFNSNAVTDATTNSNMVLTNTQFSQSGAYTVVVNNGFGSVTSAPAMLSVIPAAERRWVPGLILSGQPGNALNLEDTDTLVPAPNWAAFDSVLLTNPSQWYFDLTTPLPPQRFFRAWQAGVPVVPALDAHLIPALTLTGPIGSSLRVDGINQFGPTDAWLTLATVTLTNASQLYFDVSVIGQPARLWRMVPVP